MPRKKSKAEKLKAANKRAARKRKSDLKKQVKKQAMALVDSIFDLQEEPLTDKQSDQLDLLINETKVMLSHKGDKYDEIELRQWANVVCEFYPNLTWEDQFWERIEPEYTIEMHESFKRPNPQLEDVLLVELEERACKLLSIDHNEWVKQFDVHV